MMKKIKKYNSDATKIVILVLLLVLSVTSFDTGLHSVDLAYNAAYAGRPYAIDCNLILCKPLVDHYLLGLLEMQVGLYIAIFAVLLAFVFWRSEKHNQQMKGGERK